MARELKDRRTGGGRGVVGAKREASPKAQEVVRRCRIPHCKAALSAAILNNSHRVKLCREHQRATAIDCQQRVVRFCQQCTRLHDLDRFDGNRRTCRERLERHRKRRFKKSQAKASSLSAHKIVHSDTKSNSRTLDISPEGSVTTNAASTENSCREDNAGLPETPRCSQARKEYLGGSSRVCAREEPFASTSGALNTDVVLSQWPDNFLEKQILAFGGKRPYSESAASADFQQGAPILPQEECLLHAFGDTPCGHPYFTGGDSFDGRSPSTWVSSASRPAPFANEPMIWETCYSVASSASMQDALFRGDLVMKPHHDWVSCNRSNKCAEQHYVPSVSLPRGEASRPLFSIPTPAENAAMCPPAHVSVDVESRRPFVSAPLQHPPADVLLEEMAESADLSGDGLTADVKWLSNEEKIGYQRQRQAAQKGSFARSYLYTASFKLFGLTAADLPPNMQDHLFSMMQVVPDMVDGTIRPGCVQLTVDFWLRSEEDLQTARHRLRESILSEAGVLPSWMHNAEVTLPDGVISVEDGKSVMRSDTASSNGVEVLMVDAHLTGMDEAQLLVAGTHEVVNLRATCRFEGRFYALDVLEVAHDRFCNTIVTVCLPVHGTGLAWLELTAAGEGEECKPMPNAVPIVLTDMTELAHEVSPLLGQLWRGGRRAEVMGFLKDVYMLEHPMVAGAAFQVSCARLMAQAAHFGWEETLLEGAHRAEQSGCLREVLMGAIPGGHPLLVQAAMSGRAEITEHVVELLQSVNLLQDVRQWRASGMVSALEWAALLPDKKMMDLLRTACPASVMTQLSVPPALTASAEDPREPSSTAAPVTSGSNPSLACETLSVGSEEQTQLIGTGLARRLSSRPLALLALLLLVLVRSGSRSQGGGTEMTVLCVLSWLSIFVLFPIAHKHILSESFEKVRATASRAGLKLTGTMVFEDPEVHRTYSTWVISDMGRMRWTAIEFLYIWAPLVVFVRKTMRNPQYFGAVAFLAVVYSRLALRRRRCIGRGDLEAAQWCNYGVSFANYVVLAILDWMVGNFPRAFSFQWPVLLLCYFILSRCVHAALDAPSELGPIRWFPITRLAVSAAFYFTSCVHFGVAEMKVGRQTPVPVWLYCILTEILHCTLYWVLRFSVEQRRMCRFLQYLQTKTK